MINPLVVIIEDDPELADIYTISLESANYETETIQDGERALARLATIVPTMIILDLHLPNISGEDVLSFIQADERFAEMRILVTTADAHWGERLRPKVDLVLLKPVSIEQLINLAQRLYPIKVEPH